MKYHKNYFIFVIQHGKFRRNQCIFVKCHYFENFDFGAL